MNLNKVVLIGHLTNDPEIKTIPSGQMVCSFGLATNRVWTNQSTKQREEKTEFHSIVLWGRLAEIASQYLKKGSLAMIEGRIQTRSWQDTSGSKRYRTEIVGENIQLGPKTISQQTSPKADFASTTNKPQEQPTPNALPNKDIPIINEKDKDKEIRIEDIPF